ncbi:Werner syndrome ATP-dependent helicase [Madurella mycetomatis]|uniref:Werner syndrome ATP-dependent helicase n=1 Tax=Madurella mycetomatis TaxID=100816 RepID=A0A175W561_9PEZI|nr:Werner syndrome ATP-dependent helicase [Madurella mycetomatis]KXX78104.1 Werner syndrome ATP-dependent helicase [Madurella mycetomatis]
MDTPNSSKRLWHVSHGIVFAGESNVIYPRLPAVRYHSAPAAVPLERSPHYPSMDGSHEEHAAGQTAGNVRGEGVTASTVSTVTHTAAAVTTTNTNTNTTTSVSATSTTVSTSVTSETLTERNKSIETAQGTVAGATEKPGPVDPTTLYPPFTPLKFKIPVETFRKAKQAAEGTPESFWSYSLYRGPGANGAPDSKIKVHYCKSYNTTERVLERYFMNEKVLGFDLEWSPFAGKHSGARQNVSLVQLASPSRIGLFHLAVYPRKDKLVAPSLKKILEDPNITKTGVWIKGDCSRLKQYLNIDARGTFELSHLYKLVKHSSSGEYNLVNKHLVSLARQVQDCLELPMFKGEDVRASDWSKSLQMSQILYSSSDAYAAVQLYAMLDHKRQSLDPTPPLPHHAELNLPIRLADGVLDEVAEEAEPDAETAAAEAAPPEDTPSLSAATYDKLRETLEDSVSIEVDSDPASSSSPSSSNPSEPPRPAPKTTTRSRPKKEDRRVEEATAWAMDFRRTNPKMRAAPSSLRAYYLWMKDGLTPAEVAELLRDPPLQISTVVTYILDGIRLGGKRLLMPFDKKRLKQEVLPLFPAELLAGRYKNMLKLCREREDDEKEKEREEKGKEKEERVKEKEEKAKEREEKGKEAGKGQVKA